jgi:hypothetical protein
MIKDSALPCIVVDLVLELRMIGIWLIGTSLSNAPVEMWSWIAPGAWNAASLRGHICFL